METESRSVYRPRSARVKNSESPSLSGWSSRPPSGHAKDGVFSHQSPFDALPRSSSSSGSGSRGVTPRSANVIRSAPRPVSAIERSYKMRKQPPDFDELRQRNIRRSEERDDRNLIDLAPVQETVRSLAISLAPDGTPRPAIKEVARGAAFTLRLRRPNSSRLTIGADGRNTSINDGDVSTASQIPSSLWDGESDTAREIARPPHEGFDTRTLVGLGGKHDRSGRGRGGGSRTGLEESVDAGAECLMVAYRKIAKCAADAISDDLDSSQVISDVRSSLQQAFGPSSGYHFSIFTPSSREGEEHLLVGTFASPSQRGERQAAYPTIVAAGAGLCAWSFQRGACVDVTSAEDDPRHNYEQDFASGLVSGRLISAPLLSEGGEGLGVVVLASTSGPSTCKGRQSTVGSTRYSEYADCVRTAASLIASVLKREAREKEREREREREREGGREGERERERDEEARRSRKEIEVRAAEYATMTADSSYFDRNPDSICPMLANHVAGLNKLLEGYSKLSSGNDGQLSAVPSMLQRLLITVEADQGGFLVPETDTEGRTVLRKRLSISAGGGPEWYEGTEGAVVTGQAVFALKDGNANYNVSKYDVGNEEEGGLGVARVCDLDGNAVGVIYAFRKADNGRNSVVRRGGVFSPHAMDLVCETAAHIGVSAACIALRDALSQSGFFARSLARFGAGLSSMGGLQAVVEGLRRGVVEGIDCERAIVYILESRKEEGSEGGGAGDGGQESVTSALLDPGEDKQGRVVIRIPMTGASNPPPPELCISTFKPVLRPSKARSSSSRLMHAGSPTRGRQGQGATTVSWYDDACGFTTHDSMCVPLLHESGAVLGCVECLNPVCKPKASTSQPKFSREDVSKVELMAMQVVPHIMRVARLGTASMGGQEFFARQD